MDPVLKFIGQIAVLAGLVFIIVVGGGYHTKLQNYFGWDTNGLVLRLNETCDGLKPQLLSKLKETTNVLKIYDDVEDLTDMLKEIEAKKLTRDEFWNRNLGKEVQLADGLAIFRVSDDIDNDTKIHRFCKGRVKFAQGKARSLYFYTLEDVDGDTFLGSIWPGD